MEVKYTIPLSEIVNEFSFEKIYLPEDYESIRIVTPEVNRPGLALTGFFVESFYGCFNLCFHSVKFFSLYKT